MRGAAPDYAGRMRHRITLQAPQLSKQTGGQYALEWQDVATIWAEVKPYVLRSRNLETVTDMQLTAVVSHEIHLRYRSGVSAEMRVKYAERLFNIRNVTNLDERNIMLRLLVDEYVAQ